MNFYGKNQEQDKYFVEIRNCLELAYWISSDIDHYVENSKEKINKQALDMIFSNSINLKEFIDKIIKKLEILEGDHKECALLLANYTKFCLEEFDFINNKKRESESEDVKFSRMLDADIDFRDQYEKYFLRTDIELYRIKSYKYFSHALSALYDFSAYLNDQLHDSEDSILADIKREEILKHISNAESILGIGCRLMKANDKSLQDFVIASSGNSIISPKEYYQLQVEFNDVLKELFFVQRNFYNQFKKTQLPDLVEFNLIEYETNKYYSRLNEIGFTLSKIVLDELRIDIPDFKLLSPSIIKNPLDFVKVN